MIARLGQPRERYALENDAHGLLWLAQPMDEFTAAADVDVRGLSSFTPPPARCSRAISSYVTRTLPITRHVLDSDHSATSRLT
ncbi:hypothetical protein KQH60_06680 [Mycetohabitans sp. B8]|uniref:hypothetical protein n=1 Tax=Mycetohabitans sp. B8 TaxID=2841845 RepID=UPI001F2B98C0|nr:hypothetical protein [Mycetohabitans sp. B8]MCG1042258.1 hypothetical protein [Mycetohabitans sp. B8]